MNDLKKQLKTKKNEVKECTFLSGENSFTFKNIAAANDEQKISSCENIIKFVKCYIDYVCKINKENEADKTAIKS